jgi:hypothetical protein
MGQPTWQEIEAEAQRRGKLDFDNTGRNWTLAEKIVEVMNEGWTPPDPRREAFIAWHSDWMSKDRAAGHGNRGPDPQTAFYAGADWGEKNALELLTTHGEPAVAVRSADDEVAGANLGPVETLRDALEAFPPRPHLRPFPRQARPNVIGWAGRHDEVEVFFIPLNAWRRLFKEPRKAAQAVRNAGFMFEHPDPLAKRGGHRIRGETYYLIRRSILDVEEAAQ